MSAQSPIPCCITKAIKSLTQYIAFVSEVQTNVQNIVLMVEISRSGSLEWIEFEPLALKFRHARPATMAGRHKA